ncbi:alanine racemase [Agromyces arachidis]|uniref:alanine racemase n=1 Tax=Agromyces arachidis TaxID=766966 RepID=UPI0040571C85
MTALDLRLDIGVPEQPGTAPWDDPARFWGGLGAATADLDAPVATLHLGALRHNARDLVRRAAGTPIRVASKSLRVRGVLEALGRMPGYRGVLAFTLAEALWLVGTGSVEDAVVGYPTADRRGIRRLVEDPEAAARVTLMVDSVDQLDLVDAVRPPGRGETVRLCLDLDASWRAPLLGHVGVRRSPVHEPADAVALAEAIAARPGFRLVGIMSYEAQVAGIADRPAGRALEGARNRWMKSRSMAELVERRARAVAAVRKIADLEFVNAGGTGSIEATVADPSVTEVAAGSGLFAGHLFDAYEDFTPAPAAAFALDVVRSPGPDHAALLGGGWVASGPPGGDRLPEVCWPDGLRMLPREGAGEVQTPLSGPGAGRLRPGDRVWLRHAKSGELAEHVASFALVDGEAVVGELPTYRGEGKAFL